ncbi:hypothetical protein HDU97_003335 [Phlyctochytrium planicorne]|nr:hypothetical protein HDU97_003335 [Phlyctochytrium planicorne]
MFIRQSNYFVITPVPTLQMEQQPAPQEQRGTLRRNTVRRPPRDSERPFRHRGLSGPSFTNDDDDPIVSQQDSAIELPIIQISSSAVDSATLPATPTTLEEVEPTITLTGQYTTIPSAFPTTTTTTAEEPIASSITEITEPEEIPAEPSLPTTTATFQPFTITSLVTIGTPPLPDLSLPTPSIDIIAVVDVSGSMSGSKLASVQSSLRYIVEALSPWDRLSIVKFSSQASVVAPFLRCTDDVRMQNAFNADESPSSKRRLQNAIELLAPTGGTDIRNGLEKACEMMEGRKEKNKACAILLLSDGMDSGHRNFDGLYGPLLERLNMIECTIFTFGFGNDHDDRLLSRLPGSVGTFSFIRDTSSVQDAFAGCIGGIKAILFQNLSVTLSVEDETILTIQQLLCSQESNVEEGGKRATIKLGNLFGGESRDAVVVLEFIQKYKEPTNLTEDTLPVLKVTCEFTTILDTTDSTTRRSIERTLSYGFHPGSDPIPPNASPNPRIDQNQLRLLALKGIRDSITLADASATQGLDAARSLMQTTRQEFIQRLAKASNIPYTNLLISLPNPPEFRARSIPTYSASTYPLPPLSRLSPSHWSFYLAILEDIDRATSRYGSLDEYVSGGLRASQRTLVSTYSTQRSVWTGNGLTRARDGSALATILQTSRSSTFQKLSTASTLVNESEGGFINRLRLSDDDRNFF